MKNLKERQQLSFFRNSPKQEGSISQEVIVMGKPKKIAAIILSAVLILPLSSCSGKQSEQRSESSAVSSGAAASSMMGNLVAFGPALLSDVEKADGGDDIKPLQNGDEIINIQFDSSSGEKGGFSEYTKGGSFNLHLSGGELVSDVKNTGVVDYAVQAYRDGFALSKGCVYTYSFDVRCDIPRKIEYRLQKNGGDYHAYVGEYIDVTPEVLHFSKDFEMKEDSDPAPRLVFNMGRIGGMDPDTPAHNIYIDNIKLVVKDASNAQVVNALPDYVKVNINQLGYKPDAKKTVFVERAPEASLFYVCDAEKKTVVYEGELDDGMYSDGAGQIIKRGDFSNFEIPGKYYIYVDGFGSSFPFEIGEKLYDKALRDSILMLYSQRCGTAVTFGENNEFSHAPCHISPAAIYGTDLTKEVNGGWHDAGDYGKYVVPGAKAAYDLLLTYEDTGYDSDDLGIPESGNKVPDILDEARYELDFLLKMQDEASGGVYHKVTTAVFPETSVAPEADTAPLILSPISDTATGTFSAVMAHASTVYKNIDAAFSEKCLSAAKKAYEYLLANPADTIGFKNPEGIETGEYPDSVSNDERYWAAAELFLSVSPEEAGKYRQAVFEAVSDEKINKGLGWAAVGTYADYALAKAKDIKDREVSEISGRALSNLRENAKTLSERAAKEPYFTTLSKNFPWGSNMTIANNAMALYMYSKVSGEAEPMTLAIRQTDYLLGANCLGYCYITGEGAFSPKDPHHRPSEAAGHAVPGMLVGGPDSNLEDSYAKTILFGLSPMKCYADNAQSYSTNEVTIYWNSPLVYILAAAR